MPEVPAVDANASLMRMYIQGEIRLDYIPMSGFRSVLTSTEIMFLITVRKSCALSCFRVEGYSGATLSNDVWR
jgi:hypothetical protein